jgi:hypothetical protein
LNFIFASPQAILTFFHVLSFSIRASIQRLFLTLPFYTVPLFLAKSRILGQTFLQSAEFKAQGQLDYLDRADCHWDGI